eukprot:TCALIF_04522-PA protein Name:"Protein of unknown function" AED:0.24 eAED:0.28 QI:0/0/0/0.33/1/1/3/0/361
MSKPIQTVMLNQHPTAIMAPEQVMTREQVKHERITLMQLCLWTQIEEESILFLTKRRLLANTSQCTACDRKREIRAHTRSVDRYHWKCSLCRSCRSLRNGSFFCNSRLDLHHLVMFTYCWARNMPDKDVLWECGLLSEGAFSERGRAYIMMFVSLGIDLALFVLSFVRLTNVMPVSLQKYLLENQEQIGGIHIKENDEIVPEEADITESVIAQSKYGKCIFRGIERRTGACFMIELPDRTPETSVKTIVDHIHPGSHIYSNYCQRYAHINEIDGGVYSHNVLESKRHFIDPMDKRIHKGTLERTEVVKNRNSKNPVGKLDQRSPLNLAEYLWRGVHSQYAQLDLFCVMLACIGDHMYKQRE